MPVIGFVGLGNMGAPMARNLMKGGYQLVVYDVNAKAVEPFKVEGAIVALNPADVASSAKCIITMLPNSADVNEVFTADDGLLRTMQEGTLCMDSSTIDQMMSIKMAALCAEKNAVYIDTPVSGGVVGAQNATLTFMVGSGCEENFERAKPILSLMGKNVVNLKKVGNGQAAKICNNMLAAISMIGVSEAMNLGQRMGLDAKQLAGIINTSSGRCWSSDTYNPVPGVIDGLPSGRGYAGGFGSTLMAKDLSLAQNAATMLQASTPLGSLAHQIYRLLAEHPDFKGKDFGVVYQFLNGSH